MDKLDKIICYIETCSDAVKLLEQKREVANEYVLSNATVDDLDFDIPNEVVNVLRDRFGTLSILERSINEYMNDDNNSDFHKDEIIGVIINHFGDKYISIFNLSNRHKYCIEAYDELSGYDYDFDANGLWVKPTISSYFDYEERDDDPCGLSKFYKYSYYIIRIIENISTILNRQINLNNQIFSDTELKNIFARLSNDCYIKGTVEDFAAMYNGVHLQSSSLNWVRRPSKNNGVACASLICMLTQLFGFDISTRSPHRAKIKEIAEEYFSVSVSASSFTNTTKDTDYICEVFSLSKK